MALSQREAFARTMEHLVNHDSHGYTQGNRWGNGCKETVDLGDGVSVEVMQGDRDCSSAIISALNAVGIDTGDATYTGNMKRNILESGLFEWKDMNFNAQRGDIYLNELYHTAMCTSPYGSVQGDMLAEFSISENGTAYGNEGDQTGWESHITSYYDYPWDGILHWKNDGAILGVEKIVSSDTRIKYGENTNACKWYPEWQDDGSLRLKSAENGFYLDIANGSTESQTAVRAYEGNGTDAQKWFVKHINTDVVYNPEAAKPYEIVPYINQELCLDVCGGSTDDGTGIWTYSRNNTPAQWWQIIDHGDGSWSLINTKSLKVLAVA